LTWPLVAYFHFKPPVALMAQMLPLVDPTYTVPSGPSAGDEYTELPVAYFHFKPPVEVMA
jgi:hypothetical protein